MGGSVAGSDSSSGGLNGLNPASSLIRHKSPSKATPGDEFDGLEASGLEVGIMGTLFTVSKEKHNPSILFVAFRLLLDLVQLLLLVLNPAYGFVINSNNFAWKVFSFLQLNEFMSSRGYTFFLCCLYVMVAGLFVNVGLCAWVSKSFANNSFGHVWPIIWLRIYSLIFYKVLDLATFTLLLMSFDCGYFAVPEERKFVHQEFPDVACFTQPHIIHVAVSAVALAIFIVIATAFTIGEIDLNPKSRNLLGMGHSKVEGVAFFLKFIMSSATVFLNDVKWLSVVLFATSGYLLWLYFYWEPHMNNYVNHIRVASLAMVFWTTWMLLALAYPASAANASPEKLDQYQQLITTMLWVGLVPAALVGWTASYLRLRFFLVTLAQRFTDAPADMKPKFIYKFTDPREVEIAARAVRVWLDEDTLDRDAVMLAERILKAGKAQLGNYPFMTILWSSFLIDVQESYITGFQQLQLAKKAPNQSWIERFAIFVREQEHAQKATAATAGDAENVDLVSYVEFQRNYGLVLKLTMEAMVTRRGFWQALERHKLARFDKLAATVARIDASVTAAERMFKQVLARHSNSVKVLKLYVKFLQGVKNDPWAAARWSAEAEKLQKAEEDANTKMVLGQYGNNDDALEEANKGIIIIGANCIIRMVNDVVVKAFGFEHKNQMLGHNVNIIIPAPFSKNHNQYVRNYITTGQVKMLGATSNFVALHNDKYVIPIKVVVTHLSGIGEDSLFMGVVQPVPEVKDEATVWLLNNGNVLSCNAVFTDWLGYKQYDINGKKFSDLVMESEDVEGLIQRARGEFMAQANKSDNGISNAHRISRGGTPVAEGHEEDADPDETLALPVFPHAKTGAEDALIPAIHQETAPWTQQDVAPAASKPVSSAMKPPSFRRRTVQIDTQTHGQSRPSRSFEGPPRPGKAALVHTGPTIKQSGVVGDSWKLEGVHVRHLHSDETVTVDMEFDYGAVGDHVLYVIHMTRGDNASGMMLVADARGRVKHVTEALAARLGTTVSRLTAGGAAHARDALVPGPLIKFHHAVALQEDPGVPVPWGCRSGLPICIPAFSAKGLPELQVYTLSFEQRTIPPPPESLVHGGPRVVPDIWHVITFNPSTWEAAYDARRLKLVVDKSGLITSVSKAADSLFGFKADTLVGKNVTHILDVLRSVTVSADGVVDTTKVLRVLADRNRRTPGISWRVGVSAAVDPRHIAALGVVGEDIAAQHTKPAIMNLRYVTTAPRIEGSTLIMPDAVQYEMELWRSDVIVGVLELDPSGIVIASGVHDQPMYYPCNLLGAKPGILIGTHLTTFFPVRPGLKSIPALFTEGGILPAFGATAPAPLPPPAKKSGGMKGRSTKSAVGPTHVFKVPHYSDGGDLELRVTPVCKGSPGPGTNVYLIVRGGEKPACGRADFVHWLMTSVDPHTVPRVLPGSKQYAFPRNEPTIRSQQQQALLEVLPLESPNKRGVQFNASFTANTHAMRASAGNGLGSLEQSNSMARVKSGFSAERISQWLQDPTLTVSQNEELMLAAVGDLTQASGTLVAKDEAHADMLINAAYSTDAAPGEPEPPEQEFEEAEDMEEVDDQAPGVHSLDSDSTVMADYKRGKRFKKLSKILGGKEINGAITRLMWCAYLLLALLLAMEIAAYVIFSIRLQVQDKRVDYLFGNSQVANEANNILMYVQALDILMSNKGVPGLRYLQNNTANSSDMQRLFAKLQTALELVIYHHQGLYQGYDGNTQPLPDDYGLKPLWEEPSVTITEFSMDKLNFAFAPMASNITVSLWAAGNMFISAADNLLQNGLALNQSGPTAFSNLTDTWFVKTNGPVQLNSGYRRAAAGMLSLTIDKNRDLLTSQQIVFILQTLLVTAVSLITITCVAEMLNHKRYRVYQVFTQVPMSVVHSLGFATLNMGDEDDGEEAEDEVREMPPDEPEMVVESSAKSTIMEKKVVPPPEVSLEGLGPKVAAVEPEKTSPGVQKPDKPWYSQALQYFSTSVARSARRRSVFMPAAAVPPVYGPSTSQAGSTLKLAKTATLYAVDRGLAKSYRDTLRLAWPFALWAVVLIAVNLTAHERLTGLERAISSLNVGGGVYQALGRCTNYAIMLSSAYPNRTLQTTLVHSLNVSLDYLQDIYNDELYGHVGSDLDQTNDITDGHPSSGVSRSGEDFAILFQAGYMDKCLAFDRQDCLNSGDVFYPFTSKGLDRITKKYISALEDTMAFYQAKNASLATPAFKYIWEVGSVDLIDGRRRIGHAYVQQAHDLYGATLQLHLISFIVSVLIVVVFILVVLRPFLTRVRAEPKRVAELLASLPPEFDVESMVHQAVISRHDAEDVALQRAVDASDKSWT